MTVKPKNLAIVLARAGSKGITNKNLSQIGGFTLIEWAYHAACEAKNIDMVVLSTDYDRAQFSHLDLVFRSRPAALCTDTATSYDAILDSLDYVENQGNIIQTIVLLEPPCPFRNGQLIDDVINFHHETGSSSMVTLKPVDDMHPIRMKKMDNLGRLEPVHRDFAEPEVGLPRQLQEPLFVRDTAVYAFDAAHLKKRSQSLYGPDAHGMLNPSFTCNIDNKIDLLTANAVHKAYCLNEWDLQIPKLIDHETRLHTN